MKFNTLQKKLALIGVGADPKTKKGNDRKTLTGIIYMIPDDEICAMSKLAKCRAPCLVTSGLGGVYPSVKNARRRKTDLYKNNRRAFMALLVADLEILRAYAKEHGLTIAVRLNGTSDIAYEHEKTATHDNVFVQFPEVKFYDYSKHPARNISHIKNYSITWSYSGADPVYANLYKKALTNGHNIAVVFSGRPPKTFLGLPVVSGDKDDRRFDDPLGHVISLTPKGRAKHDQSGFVVDANIIAKEV